MSAPLPNAVNEENSKREKMDFVQNHLKREKKKKKSFFFLGLDPQSIIDRAVISCLYSYNGECTAIRVTLCTNSGLKWLMKNFRNNRHKQMSYIGIFNNHGQSLK